MSGDPNIIYSLGLEVLTPVVATLCVVSISRPWSLKLWALVALAVGVVPLILMWRADIPYVKNRLVIEGASIIPILLSIALAVFILRSKEKA